MVQYATILQSYCQQHFQNDICKFSIIVIKLNQSFAGNIDFDFKDTVHQRKHFLLFPIVFQDLHLLISL